MRKVMLAALGTLFSFSSAFGQEIGQVFVDRVSLASNVQPRLYAPLPEGEWRVTGKSSIRSSVSNVELFELGLVRVEKGKLTGLIALKYNKEMPNTGWKVPANCTRKNVFFRTPGDAVFMNSKTGYNCLTVNHTGMTSGRNARAWVKDTYDWVWKNTSGMPRFTIKAAYSLSDRSQYLEAAYYHSPEAESFPPSHDSSWRASEWHYDRLPGDPKRLAYVNKIKDWAIAWQKKVEAGFKGRPSNG